MAHRIDIAETARTVLVLNRIAARAGLAMSANHLLNHPRQATWSLPYEGIVEMLAQGTPSRAATPAAEVRRSLDRVTSLPVPGKVQRQPVLAGGVPAEWIRPAELPAERIVLYLHGGGYISGSPQTHRGLIGEIARAAGARVLAPDYRLAPEAPFPAAIEDAWAVYWWLLQQGVQPGQIVVAGDSAGGGLTIALLLALRDAGLPLPAAAVCLSPWLDLALHGESLVKNSACDYLNLPLLRMVAQMYLVHRDPHTPLASPLYADLHGLPPLLVQAGLAEMLLDDAKRFARRAADAGVPVELELWENMVHVWHFLYPIEIKARQAIQAIARFVRRQTTPALCMVTGVNGHL